MLIIFYFFENDFCLFSWCLLSLLCLPGGGRSKRHLSVTCTNSSSSPLSYFYGKTSTWLLVVPMGGEEGVQSAARKVRTKNWGRAAIYYYTEKRGGGGGRRGREEESYLRDMKIKTWKRRPPSSLLIQRAILFLFSWRRCELTRQFPPFSLFSPSSSSEAR